MNQTEQLRQLPSVDQVLRCDRLETTLAQHPRALVVQAIRESIDTCRASVLAGKSFDNIETAVLLSVERQLATDQGQSIQRVINATGILLHTNLGRAPLADLAVQRILESVGYANVELNLATGKRSKRGQRVAELLRLLCDSEDAIVVNNCAAATMLVLQAIAAGQEVIVSRGQLVEIGGGFRLPDVFRTAGVILKEVGTTNRTYVRDYEQAIGEETGAIIRVHRSNFWQSGFTTEPTIGDLVTAQRPAHIPVIDDLGSGSMHDLSSQGLIEPSVHDSVSSGADLTLFSGDKLFGGPQCGMVVGKSIWIEKLRHHPMMRAMRVDKLTLAALEATIEIHLSGQAMSEIPLLQMATATAEQVREKCLAVVSHFLNEDRAKIEIVECVSQVGGGSIPGSTMPSAAIRISDTDCDGLARQLRFGRPAIQGRIVEDSLLLDLRTVPDSDLETLAQGILTALDSTRES